MLERLVLPPWLKAGLALPLLVLNLWVLRQLLLPLAPFPALFVAAALIAFLFDLPSRWLMGRGLPRLPSRATTPSTSGGTFGDFALGS